MRSQKRYLSERGLVLEFGNRITPEINDRVRLMAAAVEERNIKGVVNLMPTFRSLLVEYDPRAISLDALNAAIDDIEKNIGDRVPPPGRYFELLTYYGEPYSYDTGRIAEHNRMSEAEVVKNFSEAVLRVYMIGFIAALPNIGDLPECLHTPRLPSPRVRLPEGMVGLGGQQVAICPVALPSGFNYIGRCFQKIYDPLRQPPSPFRVGDRIRFTSVSLEEAQTRGGEFPGPIE